MKSSKFVKCLVHQQRYKFCSVVCCKNDKGDYEGRFKQEIVWVFVVFAFVVMIVFVSVTCVQFGCCYCFV